MMAVLLFSRVSDEMPGFEGSCWARKKLSMEERGALDRSRLETITPAEIQAVAEFLDAPARCHMALLRDL
ncbi:hypothetical protein CKO29_16445 [Allochromatium vinosum]|nr:hypothetical protein [Allochromatium vinosum]